MRNRRRYLSLALAGPLASAVLMGASAPAAQADTVKEVKCTSGAYGYKYCKTLDFEVKRCRYVGIRNLSSGDNRWIRVQVRAGNGSVRAESDKLRPGQAWNGRVSGSDRIRPALWVDADGLSSTAMKIRIRFSGPSGC